MGKMQLKSDAQLLRDYAERGREAAFAEIVERHTDLVYSAALRQVYSQDFARDVAQGVFTDLARKAQTVSANLSPEASLVGWLYRGTRFAARDLHRGESRRAQRERQAVEQLHPAPETPTDWEQLRPALDDAMAELDDTDREALLLRYFKNHDLRTVGAALGISDDAAQKRVSRAVERLREFFAKRGITVGASGLVAVLSANAVQAAPIGLVATISTAALAGTAAAASTIIAATTKTIAMTTLQKTIVTATVAVLAGAGIYEARLAAQLRDQVHTLQQQQGPLTKQIQQLQSARDDATNQLALLREENERLNRSSRDLPRLRGEVGRLRSQTNELGVLKSENRQLRVAAASQDPLGALPPEQLVRAVGWGTNSCQQIAARYSETWLPQITEPTMLLKLGLALYDAGNYQDALKVFQQAEVKRPDIALVWQGHMLDLLGKREDALVVYTKAADHEQRTRHDQYGLVVDNQYLQQRIETPFARIENQMGD